MKKRAVSILLVVLMVLALMPVTVLADSGNRDVHNHDNWDSIIRVVIEAGDHGTINSPGGQKGSDLDLNDTWTFTAVADEGYRFKEWTYNGNQVAGAFSGSTQNPLSVTFTEGGTKSGFLGLDRHFKVYKAQAVFEPLRQYSLSTNVTGSGSIVKDPNKTDYYENHEVTLTANPDAGWRFVEWLGDASGTSNPLTLTMNGEKSVTAKFEPLPTYTLNINTVGEGTVSKDPDLSNYWQGRNVTLTANAASGWRFGSWSGGASGTNTPVTVSMDSNKDVTATFIKTYDITLNTEGHGHFDNKNAVAGPRDVNSTINLNDAKPDVDFFFSATHAFLGWRDNDTNQMLNSSTITLTSDRSFTAVFTRLDKLSLRTDGHGDLNNKDAVAIHYPQGKKVNLNNAQPTPDPGYTFDCWKEYGTAWLGAGEKVPLVGGQPIVTIGGCNYFEANFKVENYKITYDLDGGSVTAANPSTYTYFDKAFTLNNPTKTGYMFAGWTGTELSGPTSPVTIPKNSSGDRTYKANWTPITYTVVYDANGGTGSMAPSAYKYDEKKALSENTFTKPGCEFAGWATSAGEKYSNKQAVQNLASTNGATVTLYAQWQVNGVSVSDYNGIYDGSNHGVNVSGDLSDATVAYSEDGGVTYSDEVPKYKNATSPDGKTVFVKVVREGAAPFVGSAKVIISKATLKVSAEPVTITYGQTAPLTYTATYEGFKGTDDVSVLSGTSPVISCTSYTPGQDTGDYEISVEAGTLTAQNYTFNCVPGTLTVGKKVLTVNAENKEITYGQDKPKFTVAYSGFIPGDNETQLEDKLTFNCTYAAGSPVNTYSIMPDGLTSDNYTMKFVAGTLTVKPAPLSVTADDIIVTYGVANPAYKVSYSGFVAGDDEMDLVGPVTFNCTYTKGSPVGTYSVMPGGQTSGNYTITYHEGTLTVEKALLTVKAANKSVKYGSAPPNYNAKYTGFVAGDNKKVLSGAPKLSCAYKTGDPVNKYPITIEQDTLSAVNYDFQFEDDTLSVNKATIKVTAENDTITYWDDAPIYSVTYTGFVLEEKQEDVLTGAPKITCGYAKGNSVGDYPITVKKGNLAAANYRFSFDAGTLTVGKAELTVKADDQSVVYGDTAPPSYPVTITGYVGGQNESVLSGAPGVTCTYTAGDNAGSYPIKVVANDLDAENYSFTCVDGTLLVTPAPLTVTADGAMVTYGEAAPAFSVQYSGFVNGDDQTMFGDTLTYDCDYQAGSPVRDYDITPSGLTSGNYTIVYVSGTLTVNKAALTVAAKNETVTFNDAPPVYSVNYSGFVADDDENDLLGSLAFDCPYAAGSAVGTYRIMPDGLTSGNYEITFMPGTLTVDELILTVTFEDYDGTKLDTQQVAYGNAATAPSAPVREGYNFTGWDKAFDVVTGNMTVTAQYAIKTYSVTFYEQDGVTPIGTPQTVNWGSAAVFETAPVVTGYAFDQWVLTGNDDTETDSLTNVKEDIKAVASYIKNGYTVTFVDYQGQVIGTDGVLYGESATAPIAPEREGYTFTGWDITFDNVTGNMTVTAQYAINTYTVRFVDFDGEELNVQTVNWNTSATAPANPTRTGYTFTGWDTAFNAVTGDLTVTAQYRRNAVANAAATGDDTQIGDDTQNDGNTQNNQNNPDDQNGTQTLTDEPVPGTSDNNVATLGEEGIPQAQPSVFPWWWILIILAAAGITWFIIYRVRKNRADTN